MARFVTKQLAGWGNFPVETCHVYRPEKLAAVREVVASDEQPSYIARGLGRSYGDAALNRDSGVILYERLNRLLKFDAEMGILHAEAGVSLAEILEIFLPRGWFLPVTPGTKFVTLGGAIAADVHGKNHHKDGCISEFVSEFQLLTATGEVLNCSREENAEVFWATVGGMGLTGVILSATIKLQRVSSAYITVDYRKAANLDQALELFSGGDADYQYSVAWIDCLASGDSLGRSASMRGNHTPVADLSADKRSSPLVIRPAHKKSMPFNAPGFMLSRWSVKLFNAIFYGKHGNERKVVDYDSFFYPLDSIAHWNRMYGKRGFVQYQAVFPPESSRAGLVKMLEQLSASGRASFLAVLKTFGPQNQGLLSFPRLAQTLALDLPNTGEDLITLLRELDRTVLDHGGRVYLAKDACMDRDACRAMYPRLDEFRQIKLRLDPQNRFSSSLARRVGILEAS